jgi:hypothetical protein
MARKELACMQKLAKIVPPCPSSNLPRPSLTINRPEVPVNLQPGETPSNDTRRGIRLVVLASVQNNGCATFLIGADELAIRSLLSFSSFENRHEP